ncbi:hypothetical protein OAH22_02120 [bacterium]|nr:hypothetical protein [bacterium]
MKCELLPDITVIIVVSRRREGFCGGSDFDWVGDGPAGHFRTHMKWFSALSAKMQREIQLPWLA